MNVSSEHEAHVFQIWLRPSQLGLDPGHEKRRFGDAERRGHLRVVASPSGLEGSLMIHQDAYLYSGILSVGQRVVHPIDQGRGAWLHVVEGSVTVDSVVLETGDGVGLHHEEAATIDVTEPTEVLLLDLGNFDSARVGENGGSPVRVGETSQGSDNGSSRLQMGPG
jgi:redox-sensitive bicupin YhaK (pirin superfamily)